MSRVSVILPMILALAMLTAACGGSSSSSTPSSSSPSSSTPSTTAQPSTSSGGGGGSAFCGQAKSDIASARASLAAIAGIASTPTRLKAEFQTILAAYQKAESQAPSAIKPDIAEVYTFMQQLNTAFAAHGYNPVAAGPSAAPLLRSAKLKQAFAHLKAWALVNCGAS
jgi:hypothetical protein